MNAAAARVVTGARAVRVVIGKGGGVDDPAWMVGRLLADARRYGIHGSTAVARHAAGRMGTVLKAWSHGGACMVLVGGDRLRYAMVVGGDTGGELVTVLREVAPRVRGRRHVLMMDRSESVNCGPVRMLREALRLSERYRSRGAVAVARHVCQCLALALAGVVGSEGRVVLCGADGLAYGMVAHQGEAARAA